jgi:hypothetical protein
MAVRIDFLFHCQDCGSSEADLIQTEDKRIICSDREACELAQAFGDSNA